MEIKPIRTTEDYDAVLRRIEALWGAAHGTPDGDELDVLVTLAEAYEREHFPIDLPDPIEAIKFRLEQEGKDYRAVGVIGQRTRVYEVMRKARPLSLRMIRSLHSKLQIPAQILIQSAPTSKRIRPASRRTRPSRTVRRRSSRDRRPDRAQASCSLTLSLSPALPFGRNLVLEDVLGQFSSPVVYNGAF